MGYKLAHPGNRCMSHEPVFLNWNELNNCRRSFRKALFRSWRISVRSKNQWNTEWHDTNIKITSGDTHAKCKQISTQMITSEGFFLTHDNGMQCWVHLCLQTVWPTCIKSDDFQMNSMRSTCYVRDVGCARQLFIQAVLEPARSPWNPDSLGRGWN